MARSTAALRAASLGTRAVSTPSPGSARRPATAARRSGRGCLALGAVVVAVASGAAAPAMVRPMSGSRNRRTNSRARLRQPGAAASGGWRSVARRPPGNGPLRRSFPDLRSTPLRRSPLGSAASKSRGQGPPLHGARRSNGSAVSRRARTGGRPDGEAGSPPSYGRRPMAHPPCAARNACGSRRWLRRRRRSWWLAKNIGSGTRAGLPWRESMGSPPGSCSAVPTVHHLCPLLFRAGRGSGRTGACVRCRASLSPWLWPWRGVGAWRSQAPILASGCESVHFGRVRSILVLPRAHHVHRRCWAHRGRVASPRLAVVRVRHAPGRPVMQQIKGTVVIARLAFVEQHFGKAALEQVLRSLDEEDQRALRMLLTVRWYPFELGRRLDEAIVRVVGGGDPEFFERLGEASAEKNLATLHKSFLTPGDPHAFLRKAPQIYELYYETGRREYQ